MARSDVERLAEIERETVRALAALTEQLRGGTRLVSPAEAAEATGTVGRGDGATELAGERTAGGSEIERALESASRVISDLSQATAANTQALLGFSQGLGGLPSVVVELLGGLKGGGGGVTGFFKSGLGLSPLIGGIVGLFRKRRPEPAALVPFLEPARLALEVANTENILSGFPRVDRGQSGEVRVVEQRPVVVQPQVTVNVSAMDSRSFLDRSDEIARAVREAMLHMHPVNDLISEL